MGTGTPVSKGDLITAEKMNKKLENVSPSDIDAIDTPADGEVPTYNQTEDKFEWKTAVGVTKHTELTDKEVAGVIDHADGSITPAKLSFGVWEKVADVVVTGSPVTSIDIDGLDLDAAKVYMIFFRHFNATSSDGNILLYFNDDTNNSNYYSQFLSANGTDVFGGRYNMPYISNMNANSKVLTFLLLTREKGEPVTLSMSNRNRPSQIIEIMNWYHIRLVDENVTKITFTSTIANSIDIGSRIIIFRVRN